MLLLLVVLFRGFLFRNSVVYHQIKSRDALIIKDDKLIEFVNTSDIDTACIEEIIESALDITSEKLSFTDGTCDVNPDKLFYSSKSNCIGYAGFYASICNYLLKKYHLDKEWKATSVVGKLNLFGYDIHKLFSSPFFKDHDFVVIENKISRIKYAVDPTIHDYLGVEYITVKK
ncbi:MAG: hypothetical protein IPG89_13700 [Bacteroidetes bacterium]|nr:hypothetical protein [Bacteroidota bacterium]